jgi:hypothetical protein
MEAGCLSGCDVRLLHPFDSTETERTFLLRNVVAAIQSRMRTRRYLSRG